VPPTPDVASVEENKKRAKSLRLRSKEELHNPFVWVDLARAYENLGVREKAERMMRVALTLAPEDRFVLRSAARLYFHHDEFEQAHRVIMTEQKESLGSAIGQYAVIIAVFLVILAIPVLLFINHQKKLREEGDRANREMKETIEKSLRGEK